MTGALIRLTLSIAILLVAALLIVTHGVRGVLLLAAGILLLTAPRTRGYQMIERRLVRLTGSRQRAFALVLAAAIAVVVAVNVYEFVH